MKKEEIYDYATGIDAPYWIQQVKIGRKGRRKVLWTFTVPMQLSYFVVLILVLVVLLTYLAPLMTLLYYWTFKLSLLLYWYLPTKLARLYVEKEPQGKKMHQFVFDYIRYAIEYRLNKKAIYQGERREIPETLVFEKTKL